MQLTTQETQAISYYMVFQRGRRDNNDGQIMWCTVQIYKEYKINVYVIHWNSILLGRGALMAMSLIESEIKAAEIKLCADIYNGMCLTNTTPVLIKIS